MVSRLESGQHRFSFATLRKLAKALDAHLVYLFQDEAPSPKSRRTPKREPIVEAILARHGEKRLDPAEFKRQFGSLPTDAEG